MKTPILVIFCKIYAAVQALAGFVAYFALVGEGQIFTGVLAMIGCFVASVVVLGLGQCILYLAASAYHAERAADSLERAHPVPSSMRILRADAAPAAKTRYPAAAVPKAKPAGPIGFAGGE